MAAEGWARLRPFNADLRRLVTLLTLVVSASQAVGGGWAVIDFVRSGSRKDSISFTVYAYLVVFGILLILGELSLPPGLYNYFGFLATSTGRAFFLLFASSLALSAGWSRNRTWASSLIMIVAGFAGIAISFMGLCYGSDHTSTEEGLPEPTVHSARGTSERKSTPNLPSSVI